MRSENYIQDALRLAAPKHGYMLFRNNVGVARELDEITGKTRFIRFGLANESEKINDKWKSGDLIGWRSVIVTPDMVGRTIAIFTSRECKPEHWRYTATAREEAQARWAQLVNAAGGDACFVNTIDGIDNPAIGSRHG